MNKNKLIAIVLVLLLGGAAFYFLYLKKSNDLAIYIPKNALFVAKPNILSLGQKINFKELSEFKFYKDLMKEMSSDDRKKVDEITENPNNSGLSYSQTPVLFAFNSSKDEFKPIGGLVFGITDKDKFTKFFKDLTDDKFDITKGDAFNQIKIEREAYLIYNDKVGFFLGGDDDDDVNYKKLVERLIEQKNEESILGLETYQNFQSNPYDFNLFVNKSSLKEAFDILKDNSSAMKDIDKLINTVPVGMTLSFNEDAISLKSYADPEYKESEDVFKNKGMSGSASNYLAPNGRPLGFAGINMNMIKVYELFKDVDDFKDGINEAADELGLTPKRLFDMFSGEMSFSLVDLVSMPVNNSFQFEESWDSPEEITSTEIVPTFVIRASIANKNDFNMIMDQAAQNIIFEDGYYKLPIDEYNDRWLYVINKGDELLMTNYKDYISDLSSSKKWDKLKDDTVATRFNSNPMSIYMDLKYDTYKKLIEDEQNHSFNSQDRQLFKLLGKNLKFIQGSYNKDGSTLELKMSEKNMNSLWRLFVIAEDAYKEMNNN